MAFATIALVLRHAQTGDDDFGVVGEAKPIDTVGRGEFSGDHERGLVIARNHGAVDGAFDAVALHGKSDLLSHGLALSRGLVHRGARAASSAVHLERPGSES